MKSRALKGVMLYCRSGFSLLIASRAAASKGEREATNGERDENHQSKTYPSIRPFVGILSSKSKPRCEEMFDGDEMRRCKRRTRKKGRDVAMLEGFEIGEIRKKGGGKG